ncbi:MAG: type II toxin-antitoxin system VapC family toxin [Planctomycetes bacterium]|nr:type II toxin-antitoxin system VapC family toxin [Planctomycetota bacterium]
MPSVYIETTIPSFYLETRSATRVVEWKNMTREWWDTHRYNYELVTSRFVIREITNSPNKKRAAALELIAQAVILEEPPELPDVIEFYMEHKLMPADALGDAAHLAIASLHSIDFLLTWNCKHLANSNKSRQIAVQNARLGISTPFIVTPVTMIPEGP